MELDGILHNGQSQPGAPGLPGTAVVYAVKAFKNPGQVLLIDLRARVGKGEIPILFVLQVVGKIDFSPFSPLFDHIIEEVV